LFLNIVMNDRLTSAILQQFIASLIVKRLCADAILSAPQTRPSPRLHPLFASHPTATPSFVFALAARPLRSQKSLPTQLLVFAKMNTRSGDS